MVKNRVRRFEKLKDAGLKKPEFTRQKIGSGKKTSVDVISGAGKSP